MPDARLAALREVARARERSQGVHADESGDADQRQLLGQDAADAERADRRVARVATGGRRSRPT